MACCLFPQTSLCELQRANDCLLRCCALQLVYDLDWRYDPIARDALLLTLQHLLTVVQRPASNPVDIQITWPYDLELSVVTACQEPSNAYNQECKGMRACTCASS